MDKIYSIGKQYLTTVMIRKIGKRGKPIGVRSRLCVTADINSENISLLKNIKLLDDKLFMWDDTLFTIDGPEIWPDIIKQASNMLERYIEQEKNAELYRQTRIENAKIAKLIIAASFDTLTFIDEEFFKITGYHLNFVNIEDPQKIRDILDTKKSSIRCFRTVNLGHCYERDYYFCKGYIPQAELPSGNGGNQTIIKTGKSDVFGDWKIISVEYDSGD